MSNEMQKFNLSPQTFEQAMQYAKLIADSDFAPKDFKGKPANVLIAIQMGAELNLQPMQAIQNIAVINGRPALWGDAMLAIVKSHPDFEDINETVDNGIATCMIKRRGQSPQIRTFSRDDAKKAGLLGKVGPWTNYESRMLQLRARGFCCRDVFPDALKGINSAEELRDTPKVEYEVVEDTAPRAPLSISHQTDPDILQIHLDAIKSSNSMDELKTSYNEAKAAVQGDKSAIDKLMLATKERREYVKQAEEIISKAKLLSPKEAAIKADVMTHKIMKDIATSVAIAIDDDFVAAYENHTPVGEK